MAWGAGTLISIRLVLNPSPSPSCDRGEAEPGGSLEIPS
jgi:hypothetical protein